MKVTVSQLKRRLRDALNDPAFELDTFRPWFARVLMSVDDSDSELQDLAHSIHLLFAEAGDGDTTPKELQQELRILAAEEVQPTGTNNYTYVPAEIVWQTMRTL